jgi:hypothetical protein
MNNINVDYVFERRVYKRMSKDILEYLYNKGIQEVILAGGGLLKTNEPI